jgi:stage II sporulation protein AA (anti-sigma F factor antagonist)
MPNDPTIAYEPVDPDGVVVASLAGELDLDRADEVRDSLTVAAGATGCRYLRLDLSALDFIDSYGLGALVSVRNAAAAQGVTFSLAEPSPPVRKAIAVTGLGDIFGVG